METNIVKYNELAKRLSKYDHLKIQVDNFGLSVLNTNNHRLLTLFREPQGDIYGRIIFMNSKTEKVVMKPQFDRAINHLQKIANDIKGGAS